MMSQNRHAEKDRIDAALDYEVNLKAELEIMSLHQKLDMLRQEQWSELLAVQQDQIGILRQLMEDVRALKSGRRSCPESIGTGSNLMATKRNEDSSLMNKIIDLIKGVGKGWPEPGRPGT